MKTTYNKSFKLKFKVIKLASVTLTKKLTHDIHILKTEEMARDFVKNQDKRIFYNRKFTIYY